MKSRSFRMSKLGGPSVMKFETVDLPEPGEGEVLLKHTAIGVNLADTYRRKGIYKVPLPSGLGNEAVGVVEAVGPGVRGLKVGDRVGYIGGMPFDAYSERRIAKAEPLIRIPDGVKDREAAAALLKGMTAEYLLRRAYKVRKGDTILVHAAAGGVGTIMCQWANALGATVIGLVSTQEKAAYAKKHGCHHPLVVAKKNPKFADKVKELTGGEGVDVVYDSVGLETWDESMASLRRRGTMISFGSASGEPKPLDVMKLGAMGSPTIIRCALVNYTATKAERDASAKALFKVIADGTVKVRVNHTYKLADAQKSHRDLEARKTTGSLILVP